MNIDNKILRCHQSIMYNFTDCDSCMNIRFKTLECVKCKKKLCTTCITYNTEHFMCENKTSIQCYPAINMITNNIGIGSHNASTSYGDFDIVVNLDYPANNVAHMDVQETSIENKFVYKVGIKDNTNENLLEILNILIPKLLSSYSEEKKILFHCNQGVSRSASIAILFISLIKNITLDESFSLIKLVRPIVAPNSGFIKAMYMYKILNR